MAEEDIVEVLLSLADVVDRVQGKAHLQITNSRILREAAEEIKMLRQAINPILDLYSNPGIFPGYHSHLKKELMKDWPELAQAIQHAICLISYEE